MWTSYRTYYKGNSVHTITHSAYNRLTICIPANMYETYTEIWDAYRDEIHFTYYNEYTCVNHSAQEEEVDITILDADEIVSPNYEDILSCVNDLRESGDVLRASYQEYDGYGASHMDYYDKVCVDYTDDDMMPETLLAIASDYWEDPLVETDWVNEAWDEDTVIPYVLSSSLDIPTSLALSEDEPAEPIDTDSLNILCGDANFDGCIDMADVVTLSKASSGVVDVTDNTIAAGDLDGDETLTEDDVLILLEFEMGLVRAIPLR